MQLTRIDTNDIYLKDNDLFMAYAQESINRELCWDDTPNSDELVTVIVNAPNASNIELEGTIQDDDGNSGPVTKWQYRYAESGTEYPNWSDIPDSATRQPVTYTITNVPTDTRYTVQIQVLFANDEIITSKEVGVDVGTVE